MFARLVTYAFVLMPLAAAAQSVATGSFRGETAEAHWVFHGGAALTGGKGDAAGAGWLRLTGATNNALGTARFEGTPFNAVRGLSLSFDYVSWGGGAPGADGLSVYFYDPAGNMSGATPGGGLGYCRGAGGWLAIGLDEYGNFSHPQDTCGNGPGNRPQSLVVRGPVAAGHPLVAGTQMPGGVDQAAARERPEASRIFLRLAPVEQGTGFLLTVDALRGRQWARLVDAAPFPYAAPAQLRLGIAGSTGGAKNIHEVRDVAMQPFIPVRVRHSFQPGAVKVGQGTTMKVSLSSLGGNAKLVKPLAIALPPGLKVATPAGLAGSCRGAVTARPRDGQVVIEAGTALGAAPCDLLFELQAVSAGRWTHEVNAGAAVSDWGLNTAASAANISVE